ncbi:MAG: ABC transporter substrate-binding protein [Deltaproteobacteria bacterium]|nr:ABC transporter substrate-binding protein [Deltaproteobacteria bacterium]
MRRITRLLSGAGLAAGLLVAIALGPAQLATAGEPTDQLRETVDKVLQILRDPAPKGEAKAQERRARLKTVLKARLDFTEMARRALAVHWARRSAQERKEFVELFTDLLDHAYTSRLEGYTEEKILYTAEKVEENFAEVQTKVVTKRGTQIPIEYRAKKADSQWLVYDVVIEGVSLVNNYRTQFNKIIRNQGYTELVRKMEAKLKGLEVEGIAEPEPKTR